MSLSSVAGLMGLDVGTCRGRHVDIDQPLTSSGLEHMNKLLHASHRPSETLWLICLHV